MARREVVFAVLCLLGVVPRAQAQAPYLVKNIDEVPGQGSMGTDNCFITPIGNVVYFPAYRDLRAELWRSDGTPQGTYMVKDFYPDTGTSIGIIGQIDGLLVFWKLGNSGHSLWRSDGSGAGTWQLKGDLSPGGPNAVRVGQTLFFAAYDVERGNELWKTDATPEGTVRVRDIRTGPESSTPMDLVSVKDRLYFSAYDGLNGRQLWTSDGTDAGTELVKIISPASEPHYLRGLTVAGDLLFFSASDGALGDELWRSDGTAAGTVMVKDIAPGALGSHPFEIRAVGNVVFFSADQSGNDAGLQLELWRSDGTPDGTTLVKDINPGYYGSQPNNLTAGANALYFSAYQPSIPNGFQIWRTDGTEAGTRRLTDGLVGTQSNLTYTVGGRLYFAANDGVHNVELWQSDGTSNGTRMTADILPGQWGSSPSCLTWAGPHLFFSAFTPETGFELWGVNLTSVSIAPPRRRVVENVCRSVYATLLVRLSNPSSQTITVKYATADGSAVAGADYTATSGQLVFSPGARSRLVRVPIVSDRMLENDEYFFVDLRSADSAALAVARAQVTIHDRPQPNRCSE